MIAKPKQAPAKTPDPNEKPNKEECLDEAIADSMIASDPPASVTKGEPTAPPRRPDAAGESGKTPPQGENRGHKPNATGRG